MSLHHIAKNLETKGRGPDSVLVHMSPREVGGLQALAKSRGGSLTRNPETGLYEAGFLDQVLPIVAAAAATYFTAGAAAPALAAAMGGTAAATTGAGILAGAGAGALISGGTAAVTGKDVGKAALMGGIGGAVSGGLGAYDAAPTAELFTSAAPEVGTQSVTGVAGTGGTEGITALGGATPPPTQAGIQAANLPAGEVRNAALNNLTQGQGVFAEGATALPGSEVTGAASLVPAGTPAPVPAAGGQATTQQMFNTEAAARGGASRTVGAPESYYSSLPKDSFIQKAGIQALPALGLVGDDQQGVATTPEEQSKLKRISSNFYAQEPVRPNPYYQATYAAEGGIMRLANGGPTGPVERLNQSVEGGATNMYPQSQQERTNFATPTQMPASAEVTMNNQFAGVTMADGGITDLGSYSDGGRLLKGPGDGVSDNIPATIGGHQPARLADGEFVIPARIVSELGNGSTDAGAKRLYAMMDRVQAKRKKSIGKGKFAVNSKAAKDLPA